MKLYHQPYATRETIDVYQDDSTLPVWTVGARITRVEVTTGTGSPSTGYAALNVRHPHFVLGFVVQGADGWTIHNEPDTGAFPTKEAAIDALLVLREVTA